MRYTYSYETSFQETKDLGWIINDRDNQKSKPLLVHMGVSQILRFETNVRAIIHHYINRDLERESVKGIVDGRVVQFKSWVFSPGLTPLP